MRIAAPASELPPEQQRANAQARRLEWITIGYLITAIAVVYLVLGSSQAMKAAWIEDLLSFVPPIAFLVAARWKGRRATPEFPYGYHRSVSIAFLAASVALTI